MPILKTAFNRISKAQSQSLLRIVKHYETGTHCDYCGKANAAWVIAICTPETINADYNEIGPVYLNGESYVVGSTCLKTIKKQLKI